MTDEKAPLPSVPRAKPVPAGDTYFERLAARLPKEQADDQERGETVAEREARRLASRLPMGYVPQSGADITFDPRIAYELALGLGRPSTIFTKYGVPIERAQELIGNKVFIATIRRYQEEVTASGISFKLKAKIQAEDLLTHSYILATDPEVPAAVRADLIKWTAKVAGLEPDAKGEKGAGGSGFTLNITFAGSPSQPVGQIIDVPHTRLEG